MMRMAIDEKQGNGPMNPTVARPLPLSPPPPPALSATEEEEQEQEEQEPLTASEYEAAVKRLVTTAQNAIYKSRVPAALHPAATTVHDRLAEQVRVLSHELMRAAEWICCAEEDLALREDEVAYLREQLACAWSTASPRSAFDDDEDEDDDDVSSLEDDENESALEWWQAQGGLATLEPLDGDTTRALEDVLARSTETLSEVEDEPFTLRDLDEEMEPQGEIIGMALSLSAIFGKELPPMYESHSLREDNNAEWSATKVEIKAKAVAAEETRSVEPTQESQCAAQGCAVTPPDSAEIRAPALALAFPSAVAEGEAAAKAETEMTAQATTTTTTGRPATKKPSARQIVPPKIFPSQAARRPLGTLAHMKKTVAVVAPAPVPRATASSGRAIQAVAKTAKTAEKTKLVQQQSVTARAPTKEQTTATAATAATTVATKATPTASSTAVTAKKAAAPAAPTVKAKAANQTAAKKKNEKPSAKAAPAARRWR